MRSAAGSASRTAAVFLSPSAGLRRRRARRRPACRLRSAPVPLPPGLRPRPPHAPDRAPVAVPPQAVPPLPPCHQHRTSTRTGTGSSRPVPVEDCPPCPVAAAPQPGRHSHRSAAFHRYARSPARPRSSGGPRQPCPSRACRSPLAGHSRSADRGRRTCRSWRAGRSWRTCRAPRRGGRRPAKGAGTGCHGCCRFGLFRRRLDGRHSDSPTPGRAGTRLRLAPERRGSPSVAHSRR